MVSKNQIFNWCVFSAGKYSNSFTQPAFSFPSIIAKGSSHLLDSPIFHQHLSVMRKAKQGDDELVTNDIATAISSSSNTGNVDGIMMILSPAKTLDLSPFHLDSSLPICEPHCDLAKTRMVAGVLKEKKAKDLAKLLGISAKLADTAQKYWSDFEIDPSKQIVEGKKPAIYAFSGAAYQGIDISSCTIDTVKYMHSNLRIIDPLYGVLRPLDLIQPYRLEMATKGVLSKKEMNDCKSLAEWWKSGVTSFISNELKLRDGEKVLLNLASDEYSAAIDPTLLPDGARYIKIVFQQEGRVIAVHAKRARGLMVRYIADNDVVDVEHLKKFDLEGYKFMKDKSKEDTLVFDRKKQTPVKTSKPKDTSSSSRTKPRAKRAKTK